MIWTFPAWIPLALLVLAAPSRADQGADGVNATVFDGASGAKVSLPEFRFTPSQTPPAAAPDFSKHTKQSGTDLFYFTPEEAQEGVKLFGLRRVEAGTQDYTFDRDVPPEIQNQMRADLAFIAGIRGQGATPLHQQIFGAVDGGAYAAFFKSRVTGIGMSSCGSSNAVACVMPFWNPSKMWLTQNYIKFSHPQVSRMMVVYHEARHTESSNGNWSHAACPTPFQSPDGRDMRSIWTGSPLAGEPACDATPKGSYGSSTIMLKNIQKHCTSCSEKVRMDAGLYADDQLGRITAKDARRQMEEDFKL